MSPRRKSGLSPEDLQALKHLPAVLRALEHLQEQHAKVRAVMGSTPVTIAPLVAWTCVKCGTAWTASQDRICAACGTRNWPEVSTAKGRLQVPPGPEEAEVGRIGYAGNIAMHAPAGPRNPTLDTPERREYEAAKREGRKVPAVDPFANASPAQRERMAEQRALIDAERQARGMPRQPPAFAPVESAPHLKQLVQEGAEEEVSVRTEPLDTISDGTTPMADDADDEPEVH
jgi:hypothetical protein